LYLNCRQAFHHVGFFKGKLRSQIFFEVPPDCYCTSVNTTWRTAGTEWSVQNLRQLSLHGTNIMPIQNSKMQATSSLTFSSVQLYSTCN
jgi:hypothetical protein